MRLRGWHQVSVVYTWSPTVVNRCINLPVYRTHNSWICMLVSTHVTYCFIVVSDTYVRLPRVIRFFLFFFSVCFYLIVNGCQRARLLSQPVDTWMAFFREISCEEKVWAFKRMWASCRFPWRDSSTRVNQVSSTALGSCGCWGALLCYLCSRGQNRE